MIRRWAMLIVIGALMLMLGLMMLLEAYLAEISYATGHDYCPDIPGTQELIDGAVICDAPILENRPREKKTPTILPNTGK